MHQLFVAIAPTPPTHLLGWVGDSGTNVWGSDLLSSPAVPGMCQANDITQMYPVEFTFIKSRTVSLSRSP